MRRVLRVRRGGCLGRALRLRQGVGAEAGTGPRPPTTTAASHDSHGATGRGRRLRKAQDIPDFLLSLRKAAAAFAGVEPEGLQHVLVTEYGPGAGIGWHRDKSVFGETVGVSLLSPCVLRLRGKVGERKWERTN